MVFHSNYPCPKIGIRLFSALLALLSLGFAQPKIDGCPELEAAHFKRTQLIGNSSGGQLLEPIQIMPFENIVYFGDTARLPYGSKSEATIINFSLENTIFLHTKNVKIIETLGHTPGSITALVETGEGLLALIGDAAIVKEDLLELRAPSVVTKNIQAEVAVNSLRKIRGLNPVLVIPGHDAPFSP